MGKKLLIVESPAKAKTIGKFLGSDFKVLASMGHVRDLPTSKLGIDVDHKFEPSYVIPTKAKKTIAMLKDGMKEAEVVVLATDPDREGEAIAWHINEILKPKVGVKRIVFHEISKAAVEDAINNSRAIDLDLVEAQVARRELDRLVGYTLSPFLWKKIARGLSAGRVQSVAVRLVVERENEIKKFKTVEYWSLTAKLEKGGKTPQFLAQLISADGKSIDKLGLDGESAKKFEALLKSAKYEVKSVDKKEVKRTPPPPYTTSTMQQDAIRKLGFSAKRTMMLAQQLYEDGFITYMRTDSVNMSNAAAGDARDLIKTKFGAEYLPEKARHYANKSKNAQEAHEAIRPVHLDRTPDDIKTQLDPSKLKLYSAIWKRAVASQMCEARFERTTADIVAGSCIFRANGQQPVFAGYLKVYGLNAEEEDQDGLLPDLEVADKLNLIDLLAEQHFTEPPARYTEATLVKALEELGIGRPSTYAPTLSTIQDRGYVTLVEKKFEPQDIGELVTDLLVKHFPQIVDYKFTAGMEDQLDDIADGKRERPTVLAEFYEPYAKLLKEKEKELSKEDVSQQKIEQKCPKCGKDLMIKYGRYGRFIACTGFPDCDFTEQVQDGTKKPVAPPEPTGEKCPKCGCDLVKRKGRFGFFVGCSAYPKCDYIEQKVIKVESKCPKCKSDIVVRRTKRGKVFWGCSSYPKCDYASWTNPDEEEGEKSKVQSLKSKVAEDQKVNCEQAAGNSGQAEEQK